MRSMSSRAVTSVSDLGVGAGQQDDGQQAGDDDGQCGHGAFFVGAARGFGVEPGGQGVEVHGAQQQGGGQFFHGVDEDQQRRRGQGGTQQGQVDAAQRAGAAFAEQAGGLFERCGHAGQAGFDGAGGDGQEADGVGDDQAE